MTARELMPSLSDIDRKCQCTSCKNKHLFGERVMIRMQDGYKDYCPKCLKGRTTVAPNSPLITT